MSRRAIGAAVGLAVVLTTYGPSGIVLSGREWAAVVAIGIAVALAELLPSVRALLPIPGVAPLTILAALLAIYLCVPETDQVPVAAILPVAVVVLELVGRRQVGLEWYAIAAASVGWAGLFGASGRQSALIGALFAWWAVLLLPIVQILWPLRLTSGGDQPGAGRATLKAVVIAVIAGLSASLMARTGGIADSTGRAVLAAAVIATVSHLISFVIVGQRVDDVDLEEQDVDGAHRGDVPPTGVQDGDVDPA